MLTDREETIRYYCDLFPYTSIHKLYSLHGDILPMLMKHRGLHKDYFMLKKFCLVEVSPYLFSNSLKPKEWQDSYLLELHAFYDESRRPLQLDLDPEDPNICTWYVWRYDLVDYEVIDLYKYCVQFTHRILEIHFGKDFSSLSWMFSFTGNRGIHIEIFGEPVYKMREHQRMSILNTITEDVVSLKDIRLRRLQLDFFHTIILPKLTYQDIKGIAEEMDHCSREGCSSEILEKCEMRLMVHLLKIIKDDHPDFSPSEQFGRLLKLGKVNRILLLKSIKKYIKPTFDGAVTYGKNHNMRLPFSIHGKTDFIKAPYFQLDDFVTALDNGEYLIDKSNTELIKQRVDQFDYFVNNLIINSIEVNKI